MIKCFIYMIIHRVLHFLIINNLHEGDCESAGKNPTDARVTAWIDCCVNIVLLSGTILFRKTWTVRILKRALLRESSCPIADDTCVVADYANSPVFFSLSLPPFLSAPRFHLFRDREMINGGVPFRNSHASRSREHAYVGVRVYTNNKNIVRKW